MLLSRTRALDKARLLILWGNVLATVPRDIKCLESECGEFAV
jgi:hypothetical protein